MIVGHSKAGRVVATYSIKQRSEEWQCMAIVSPGEGSNPPVFTHFCGAKGKGTSQGTKPVKCLHENMKGMNRGVRTHRTVRRD